MKLIQFGEYIFPYNPAALTITMEQKKAVHSLPLRGEVCQLLGRGLITVQGESEAVGEYGGELISHLTACLKEQREAVLVLPECEPFAAVLTRLELNGKGGREKYAFRFVFTERTSVGKTDSGTAPAPYLVNGYGD